MMAINTTVGTYSAIAPRQHGFQLLPTLIHMMNVLRQRQALRGLSVDALNDIGVSRQDAIAEANRAFWDTPAYFR